MIARNEDMKGKVDVRTMKKNGMTRLRFYNVYPDQKEMILLALQKARTEMGTEHDTVALDAICLNYLSGAIVKSAD